MPAPVRSQCRGESMDLTSSGCDAVCSTTRDCVLYNDAHNPLFQCTSAKGIDCGKDANGCSYMCIPGLITSGNDVIFDFQEDMFRFDRVKELAIPKSATSIQIKDYSFRTDDVSNAEPPKRVIQFYHNSFKSTDSVTDLYVHCRPRFELFSHITSSSVAF